MRYLRGSPGISLHYKAADGNCGRWNQLRHKQTGHTLDVYTDASFAADEQCRSFGSVQLFWGGALVSWSAARQTLIAAHTAECELYSLSEGHLMGKAFLPTVAALMNTDVQSMQCHLYCDNMAAVQLCTLEAGSWRTRHLRLRGAIIRQDLDKEEWTLAHLDGVFMPADLGTKPVGPARLEDLLRLCDLWTPHLEPNENPPRPSVAVLQSSPSGFTSTLLALLMLVQVSGARAQEHIPDRSIWETFVFGFGLGFGLGCGVWAATKVGQCLDVGLEELRRLVRTSRSCFWVRLRGRRLQPEELEASRSQAPIANEAAEVLIPLNNGTLVPLEEATYDDIRDAYYADLRNAFVQAGEAEDMPEVLRENAELRRLREGLGSPRAPTVTRPPGYPEVEDGGLVARLEQPVYQLEPVDDVIEGQSSDDESEESSPTAGSTASGGARQLPETGSDATSRSRGDSVASHQGSVSRVAGLSVALIPRAQGARAAEEMSSGGSWELWIILGLIVAVSIGVGVLGAWCVGRCTSRSLVVPWNQKPVDLDNEDGTGNQVKTPVNQAPSRPQHLSPVINITVTGGVFEERASKGVDVQVTEVVSGQGPLPRTSEPQTSGVRGLDPGNTLRRRRGSDEGSGIPDSRSSGSNRPCAASQPVEVESDNANTRTLGNRGVDPCRSRDLQVPMAGRQEEDSARTLGCSGLGPSRPRALQESVNEGPRSADTRTLGYSGLGPHRPRVLQEPASEVPSSADTRTLGPKGLVPCRTGGEQEVEFGLQVDGVAQRGFSASSRGEVPDMSAASAGATVDNVVRRPVDRFPRPRGMKKKEYLSSRGEDIKPFVYFTQYGQCLHSGTMCRPMQCAGMAIQRSLCRFCFGVQGELPSRRGADGADRVVYLTRSGHYVHASDQCECLDPCEELQSRKLCQCCRWK